MFKELQEINVRPTPFQFYTASELWTNEHTSKKMLEYHLNNSIDAASRNIDFIERSVEWIVSHFGVNENTEIADFGCGPGIYTTKLSERNAKVTGIDFSKNSLNYASKIAKQQNLQIEYIHSDYLDVELVNKFDLITMIMCDYCALSPDQRKQMLSKFHSLLKPNGSLLLDVYSLNVFDQREESATYELNQLFGFWSPEDYYCFVNIFKYENEKVMLDKYTIFDQTSKRQVYNWLQYFSKDSLTKEFEESGFKIEEFYSDIAGMTFTPDSQEMAVVAMKI